MYGECVGNDRVLIPRLSYLLFTCLLFSFEWSYLFDHAIYAGMRKIMKENIKKLKSLEKYNDWKIKVRETMYANLEKYKNA